MNRPSWRLLAFMLGGILLGHVGARGCIMVMQSYASQHQIDSEEVRGQMSDEYPDAGVNSWQLQAMYGDRRRADDGEPITAAWMIEEYGFCDLEVPPDLGVAVDQDNAVFLEIATAWRYAQTRLPHIRTRGQLRQLLALLGYQEKEGVR